MDNDTKYALVDWSGVCLAGFLLCFAFTLPHHLIACIVSLGVMFIIYLFGVLATVSTT